MIFLGIVRRLVGGLLLLLVGGFSASAHDPSAYGGLFRSRNFGETWLNADIGLFLNAALAIAVDPRDPAHLLLGTDIGLLSSRSGGRTWQPEASQLIVGAVFAVGFAPQGGMAICAAPSGVFRWDGEGWTAARAPADALPARAVAFGRDPARIFLLGRQGLLRSDDGGKRFQELDADLLAGSELTALAVARAPREVVYAVVGGRLLVSEDGGERWTPVSAAPSTIDTVVVDAEVEGRIWAAAANRLYRSDDLGQTWRPVGVPLPESDTTVRGVAANPSAGVLLVSTHRGLFRSDDGGLGWQLKEGNLPIHLEAGPIGRDPTDSRTLYAVYSLMPFGEVWRTAVEGSSLLARADPMSLVGGLAFVLLLIILGILAVRWLVRARRAETVRQAP